MSGSFTETFGGSAVRPSQPSYLALTIAANTELVWPLETTAGSPVVAAMMDVTASTTSLELAMPPGITGSSGVATMITNVGANTFTVTDQAGNTIVAIPTTQSWLIALTSNATTNGTWRALQMASTTSSATAAALAGPGLKAAGSLLELNYTPAALSTNTTLTAAYRAKIIEWTGAADGTLQLDTLANLTAGWSCMISNNTAFDVHVTTSGGNLINGDTSLDILAGESATIIASTSQFVSLGVLLGVLPVDLGGTGASDATAALVNLGGTTIGIGVFTAPSAASVIALLGLNNFTFRESTVSTNQAVPASAGNTAYVATAALTATLPLTTSVTTSFVVSFYAQGGDVTIAPQATDAFNDLTAGVSFVLPERASVLMTTDGAGNWWPFFLSDTTAATWAVAAGTGNAITVTYSPPYTTVTDGLLVGFRASAANTISNPTIGGRTIVKDGGQALVPGDIPGQFAESSIRYNLAANRWELLNPANSVVTWAPAGGNADANTLAVRGANGGLYDGMLLGFRVAGGPNTITNPTLNVNTLGALTIVKGGGQALVAGDIPGGDSQSLVRYDLANTRWELLNPYTPSGFTGANQSLADPGFQILPGGLQMKWGSGATVTGVDPILYAAQFPTATLNVQLTIIGGSAPVTLHPLLVGATDEFGFVVYGDAAESISFNWLAFGH